jgi:5-formyltetrahydrofolate cyclo-ligase
MSGRRVSRMINTEGMSMTNDGTKDEEMGQRGYASSPCLMHELDSAHMPSRPQIHPERRAAIYRWRREERARLIHERLAMSPAVRIEHGARMACHLDMLLSDVAGRIVSFYWPIRGEPDLRGWISTIMGRGALTALPVVIEKNVPLVFRSWNTGDPLVRGIWNIPIPERGKEVIPDIVLAPVVGFDEQSFRLGYGGGYFDRTLVRLQAKPCVIGVGYSGAKISTIFPLDHDIGMDVIVTERRIEGFGRRLGRLCRFSAPDHTQTGQDRP